MKRHRINTPRAAPFPIPKLGLGKFNYMWIEMLVRSVYT